jgi:hypothetical protein
MELRGVVADVECPNDRGSERASELSQSSFWEAVELIESVDMEKSISSVIKDIVR